MQRRLLTVVCERTLKFLNYQVLDNITKLAAVQGNRLINEKGTTSNKVKLIKLRMENVIQLEANRKVCRKCMKSYNITADRRTHDI